MAGLLGGTTTKKGGGLLGGGISTGFGAKLDTTTSQGLYQLAVNAGLQKDADRLLASQRGEDTRKIFSGGFISDIFDTLNALQYGVVGVLKGKSFMEGVKTRQSFSDKDALGDKGLPGVIAGIALDIAVDPLTYIAPATILKKVPGLSKLGTAIKSIIFGKKVAKAVDVGGDITKGIGKIVDTPLAQEARKYKTAEEFVKAQKGNILQHASDNPNLTKFEDLTKVNKNYQVKLNEFNKLENQRKALKTRQDINNFDDKKWTELRDWLQNNKPPKVGERGANAGEGIYLSSKTDLWRGAMEAEGKKLGKYDYDVLITNPEKAKQYFQPSGGGQQLPETLIQPNEGIILGKTGKYNLKSQLTDIWKKANKAVEEVAPRSFETVEGGTKAGRWLADKFVYMFGKDPIYKEAYLRSVKNIAVGTQNVADMAKGIANLTPEVTKKLLKRDSAGRLARVGLKELQKILTPEEFAKVAPAWNKIDDLGKQAVDLGLLGKGKFEENFGEYIKNAYTEYETAKKGLFGYGKVGVKGIKARKAVENISEFGLTQVDNPAYLLFKSTFDLTKDIENAKLLGTTAKVFGTDIAREGFKQLPKTAKFGLAGGKYIPENIAKDIMEIIEPSKEMMGKAVMANFKFAKVILNPATHARNIVSNQVLNWWKLGMNPLDPRTLKAQAIAIKEIAKGGKFIDEAKTAGYGLDTFASQELRSLLDSPEALGIGKKIGNTFEKVKSKLGNIYQEEENFAKLSAFIFQRKKGLGIEDAWKAAESATFNYAQVTPFIRKLRTSLFGFPFITFTTKATPLAVETALKAPRRISVFGKIKQAIEEQSDIKETARERASEPSYIKDGFYIKLPIKDKNGRSAYFDLTYIIPFGDLVSGNFFERQTKRETGTPESLPEALLSKSPFFQFIKEIGRNEDFYGDKIWQDSDSSEKQLGDLMRHLSKTYLPPLVADQIPGGYNTKGERRIKGLKGALTATPENQQRNLMQEMLRNVGAKIQPIDVDIQETFQEWNKQKALETLLRERGVGAEFSKFFIPKK